MLFSETTEPFVRKFYKAMKNYYHDAGHMINMAVMRIFCKNPLKIFCPGTSKPILMMLGMKPRDIKFIIVYSNSDPELTLTLTYFMAMSIL